MDLYLHLTGCDDSQHLLVEGATAEQAALLSKLAKAASVSGGGCTPSLAVAFDRETAEKEHWFADYDDLTKIAVNGTIWSRRQVWDDDVDGNVLVYKQITDTTEVE